MLLVLYLDRPIMLTKGFLIIPGNPARHGIQTTGNMAEIAHSYRLARVRLVCRGCKFQPSGHANSPRLSLVCVYAWRFGQ